MIIMDITSLLLQTNNFTPIINIFTILLGVMSFMISMIFFTEHQRNAVWCLRLFKTPFFFIKLIRQDFSFKDEAIKSKDVRRGNGVITMDKRSYLVTNETDFHKLNRPCYVYYYDNPLPIQLKQYVDSKLMIDGKQVPVTLLTTRSVKKAPYDSMELHDAIEIKVLEALFNIPMDIWKMITMVLCLVAVLASVYGVITLLDISQGMAYDNKLIEQIAQQHQITLPDVKPRMFK